MLEFQEKNHQNQWLSCLKQNFKIGIDWSDSARKVYNYFRH